MSTGSSWSPQEVDLTIEDYFAMLLAETEGKPYSKVEHFRALGQKLDDRTKGSIERKHQNISAILRGLGIPPIDGYKPLGNYQHLLEKKVIAFLHDNPQVISRMQLISAQIPAAPPSLLRYPGDLIVPPPDMVKVPPPSEQGNLRLPAVIYNADFAGRDKQNRKLGEMGEEFVLELEKKRLGGVGRDDLAKRVEWVSRTVGDGLGYDIISFDERTDREKWVEVKTTNQGYRAPFYITSNELRVAETHPEEYRLYRLFRFSGDRKLFVLNPPLGKHCILEPKVFRACF
jgi:hypothetical protein